jgi:large subunit ribosomal protein L15
MVLGSSASELDGVKDPVTEALQHADTKVRSHVPVTAEKLVLKVASMPLQRRVPKFGFTNPNRVEYKGINLDTLQELIDRKKLKAVTVADLMENGLAGKHDLVKILGRGELKSGVSIQAHKFSAISESGY